MHLLGLLILLRLILDHCNLFPHAPGDLLRFILDHWNLLPHSLGDLGNLIDVLHLRNLHDFLQFGCSEHLRLHLRIFTAFVWSLDLFLLHNWDFNYSFSELPQFSVPLASLAPASRFQESQSKIEYDSSSAFCTVRFGEELELLLSFCCTCAPSTVFCTVRTDLRMFTELSTTLSMNCSLILPTVFFGRLGLLKSACVTQLAHHLVNVLPLRALGVFGQLFDLCLDLVSFSTPSLCCSRVSFTSKVYKTCRIR